MILTILIMVVATVAVAALYLAPRLGEARVVYPITPDRPVAFGYQMAWLAIRSRDTAAVVGALGLAEGRYCNWNSGIGTVYDPRLGQTQVFVSPPVNGWTFVVGLPLPQPMGRSFVDKATPLLLELGQKFVEVQLFVAFPPVDLFAWARVIDGRIVRAFAVGDEGVIWNRGKTTREERALGLKLFELRPDWVRSPLLTAWVLSLVRLLCGARKSNAGPPDAGDPDLSCTTQWLRSRLLRFQPDPNVSRDGRRRDRRFRRWQPAGWLAQCELSRHPAVRCRRA